MYVVLKPAADYLSVSGRPHGADFLNHWLDNSGTTKYVADRTKPLVEPGPILLAPGTPIHRRPSTVGGGSDTADVRIEHKR